MPSRPHPLLIVLLALAVGTIAYAALSFDAQTRWTRTELRQEINEVIDTRLPGCNR